MNCPNCNIQLSPWPWHDGGYKGVRCDNCRTHWWSDEFAINAYEAEVAAVKKVIEQSKFPSDGITANDYEKNNAFVNEFYNALRKLSAQDLAHQFGVTQETIYQWSEHKNLPIGKIRDKILTEIKLLNK